MPKSRLRGITSMGSNRLEAIYTSEVSLKLLSTFAATLTAVVLLVNVPAVAQEEGKTAAAELTADSQQALAALVATVPLAKSLATKATAILVFPKVKKAGLGIGGQVR